MESHKRGPGRPRKGEPFDGPIVLTLNKKREKVEIELTTGTKLELDEYQSWVEECDPELGPGESWFTTFEYVITTLLRTDKKWRAYQRKMRGGEAKKDEAPPSPSEIVQQPESVEIKPGVPSAVPYAVRTESDARKPTTPPAAVSGHVASASPSLPPPGS